MRTYFETLLHRKRGEYGPLWLFELDSETWAIVWEECLDDEDTCRLILSEDPSWFNREWHKDGRRPNPTYGTRRQALAEVIRSLQTMKEAFETGDVKRSHYSAYAALAEYHLHMLEAEERSSPLGATELPSDGAAGQFVEATEDEVNLSHPLDARMKPLPAPAPEAEQPKKPWEVANTDPTGVNFRPDASLHAKMEWVCKNVPGGMSRLRILREGAELLCNQLIEKTYREKE